MGFGDLINLPQVQVGNQEEARFSFLKGGYVQDFESQGTLYFLLLLKVTLCRNTMIWLKPKYPLNITRKTVINKVLPYRHSFQF